MNTTLDEPTEPLWPIRLSAGNESVHSRTGAALDRRQLASQPGDYNVGPGPGSSPLPHPPARVPRPPNKQRGGGVPREHNSSARRRRANSVSIPWPHPSSRRHCWNAPRGARLPDAASLALASLALAGFSAAAAHREERLRLSLPTSLRGPPAYLSDLVAERGSWPGHRPSVFTVPRHGCDSLTDNRDHQGSIVAAPTEMFCRAYGARGGFRTHTSHVWLKGV